ncbi:MAG: hypothetical protein GY953_53415 [bacterium]|nr:hypothetical protein [bacterium]
MWPATLIDLETGIESSAPGWVPDHDMRAIARQLVTSDGRVLIRQQEQLALWGPAGTTLIATEESVQDAVVNDLGTIVVYQSRDETTWMHQLRAVSVADGGESILSTGSADPYFFSVANDGGAVLYSTRRAKAFYVASADTLSEPSVFEVPDGVREAVLSGSGRIVWVATGAGRILRFDIPSSDAQEVVGRTPYLWPVNETGAPGSLIRLTGTGLSAVTEVAAPPLPRELGGVRVEFDGRPAPLWSVSPTEILLQIPFEAALESEIDVIAPQWQFDTQPRALILSPADPEFYRHPFESGVPGGDPIAVHADFSALVTEDNPVVPGEIVHFYMAGLGAVTPPLPTGEAAPLDRLHRASRPLQCSASSDLQPEPVEVLFAGLAPGLVGIYQVSLRTPPSFPGLTAGGSAGRLFIMCGMPPYGGAAGSIWATHP